MIQLEKFEIAGDLRTHRANGCCTCCSSSVSSVLSSAAPCSMNFAQKFTSFLENLIISLGSIARMRFRKNVAKVLMSKSNNSRTYAEDVLCGLVLVKALCTCKWDRSLYHGNDAVSQAKVSKKSPQVLPIPTVLTRVSNNQILQSNA